MFEIGFEIIGNDLRMELPERLVPRNESVIWMATSMLAVSFFLVAFAKLSSRQLIYGMLKAVYKNKQVEKIIQEEYPLKTMPSFFLVLNYVVSGGALLFLSMQYFFHTSNSMLVFLLMLIPLAMVFFPWFSLVFVGMLTGERAMVKESILNTWLLAQFSGILYSLLLLIWTFNLHWSDVLVWVFFGLSAAVWAYRFLRGFIFTFTKGTHWYYIILYFCTLEILPFVLGYWALNIKI